MKLKKLFIVVAFGLFGLSLSGSAVRAMESSGKNDGFAENLNKINLNSKLENVSQQSEETVHKPLNVDKNEANKIKETGKANDFEFNFEKPIELFGNDRDDVILGRKHKLDEQEEVKEFKKIKVDGNRIVDVEVNKTGARAVESSEKNNDLVEELNNLKLNSNAENVIQKSEETVHKTLDVDKNEANKIKETGKANDFEFNFEKPIELFGNNRGDVVSGRKHVSDEREDVKRFKKFKVNENRIVDVEVDNINKNLEDQLETYKKAKLDLMEEVVVNNCDTKIVFEKLGSLISLEKKVNTIKKEFGDFVEDQDLKMETGLVRVSQDSLERKKRELNERLKEKEEKLCELGDFEAKEKLILKLRLLKDLELYIFGRTGKEMDNLKKIEEFIFVSHAVVWEINRLPFGNCNIF